MDRDLTLFSLKPKEGSSSTAEFAIQDFNMKDVASVYKDSASIAKKAPKLAPDAASCCIGLDTSKDGERRLFFNFGDKFERDKFYTCLKILRMSVDVDRSAK